MVFVEVVKSDHITLDVTIESGDFVDRSELGRNFPCDVYANLNPFTGAVIHSKEARCETIKTSTQNIFHSLQAERSA